MKVLKPNEVAIVDVAGGVPIDTNRFKAGDLVKVLGIAHTPVMKVIGNAVDQRTGEKRAVVIWFNAEYDIREAALHEDLLYQLVSEQ